MRKLFLTFTLALASLTISAVPARRGLWQILTLPDGKEIKAQLVGDEHMHFWVTEDGQQFTIQPDGKAVKADMEQLRNNAHARRSGAPTAKRLRSPRKTNIGDRTHYTGQKKGIVILMQFTDTKFKTENDLAKYNDILNKENYQSGNFIGSVADYFKAQSGGQFELTFDVVGPYNAKKNASYYGSNDYYGNDQHADELIVEGLKAADDEVDFKDYDWDNDGLVDQVFVVYAGKGEADSGNKSTIWPHMYFLSKTNMTQKLDGVTIDTYACSNELAYSGSIAGIGCFCHEFSHCLGYPDFYDIAYKGWFGMSEFDIMDAGNYNGDSFCPAGYSAYEKWMAGWIEPTVLAEEDVNVKNLTPTSENGGAYIMYNDAHQDEFYIIENRQKTNWDAGLPGKGLMITHVDFDKMIWEQNTPNSLVTQMDVQNSYGEYTKTNDHQRCTIFHADNDDDSQYWNEYAGYFLKQTLSTDLYPYQNNDSLTATSKPAASLYNKNSLGKKVMQGAILNIKQNSDKTMNFNYRATEGSSQENPDPETPYVAHGDTLFYESFDKCNGTGGNDDVWSTTIANQSSKFATDNAGWDYFAAYGGYQCARFGNNSKSGEATTPLFTIDGEAELTFRVSGWNNDGMTLNISASSNTPGTAVSIEPSTFTMKSFEWTEYTVSLNGTGNIKLTFMPQKRFILDEVLVLKSGGTTAISNHITQQSSPNTHDGIYTLDGRLVTGSLNTLPHGIYIIGGRKVVK